MARRILVVDDEPDIRATLRMLLGTRGYEVDEAEDGGEAISRLGAGRYDLVILDLLMPRLHGYEVVKALPPEVLDATPIVVLTAKSSDADVMRGYSAGATYYLTKPFSNRRVLDIVEYLMGDLSEDRKLAIETRL